MEVHLEISKRRFCTIQIVVVTTVILLGAVSYIFPRVTGHTSVFGFLRMIDVANEQGLATLVSSLNLLVASILLFLVFLHARSVEESRSRYWLFMCFLFVLLGVDEAISIHERFSSVYIFLVDRDILPPFLGSHQWLPFGVVFVCTVGVIVFPWLRRLESQIRKRFLISGLIFLSGAVGLEFVGALMLENEWVTSKADAAYQFRRLLEESLEMYAIVFFNCTLVCEINRRNVTFKIGTSA